MAAKYRGRFAPSPTGPLHFGSLVAAVASFCQARASKGEWLVRLEDIDPPREIPGAADDILRSLENFGLEWDAAVVYQSQRQELYQAALDDLEQQGKLYPCACSRKEISKMSPSGLYPGTCRHGMPAGKDARSLRLKVEPNLLELDDAIQGKLRYQMQADIGDFVLKRADGLFAYQLAVAIDDAEQEITEVVRGSDLLESTPRQIYLHEQLGYPSPDYAHHPVIVNSLGNKLSKQNLAPALDNNATLGLLYQAVSVLGQNPPAQDEFEHHHDLLKWTCEHWNLAKIPQKSAIKTEDIT